VSRRWDQWLGDIPLRYPPYNTFKHQGFKFLADVLMPVQVPGNLPRAARDFIILVLAFIGFYFICNEWILPLLN